MTGDDACMDTFGKNLDYIHATLRRLGAAPGEIEDLAQELFVVLRRRWASFDQDRPAKPYLFAIAFRIVWARHRRLRREVAVGDVAAVDPSDDPEEALERKQARELLLAMLEHVPLRRRAVLVMVELDGVPVAEIAATLKMSVFTVYARLRKARRELATALRRTLRRSPGPPMSLTGQPTRVIHALGRAERRGSLGEVAPSTRQKRRTALAPHSH